MKWENARRSGNIIDKRGAKAIAGGGGGLLVMAVIVALMGGDPTQLLVQGASEMIQTRFADNHFSDAEQEELVNFSAAVLGDTEDTWQGIMAQNGQDYPAPHLILYTGAVQSACGTAQSAVGPFYCPGDQNIYLDLNFFYELKGQLGAPGDFARAYVIAHEVGHHVQYLTGQLETSLQDRQNARNPAQANAISVHTELMADCYAGVWAHSSAQRGLLEQGDIEEALHAATRIGDDTLQQETQGHVVPDSFTHGSAQQRYNAFKRGFDHGDMKACDNIT